MKRFLVLLTVVAFLTFGIFSPRVSVEASTPIPVVSVPDVVTTGVMWISPSVRLTVEAGTFGIVVRSNPLGFVVDVPGGHKGSGDVAILSDKMPSVATGVLLKLQGKTLSVYFGRSKVINLGWNDLSVGQSAYSIFKQDLLVAQVVKAEDTGSRKFETSYCAGSLPVVKKFYFYKIYLTTTINPYDPPEQANTNLTMGILVPEDQVENIKGLALRGNYVWVSLMGLPKMYFWLPLGMG